MTVQDNRLERVGQLERVETEKLLTGYTFNFRDNSLAGDFIDNPTKETVHRFIAYRIAGSGGDPVTMRATSVGVPDEFDD